MTEYSKIPAKGTEAYGWWRAGAQAEAQARREGRSKAGLEVRSFVDAVAESHREQSTADIATLTYSIYVLAGMPLRQRARRAWRVLRGRA